MSSSEVPEYDDDLAIKYTVQFEQSRKWPGKILAERWFNRNGVMSAMQGHPAETIFDPETGNKVSEAFYKSGYLLDPGRDNPAVRKWDPHTQNVVLEMFYAVDDLHRDKGLPALIEYHPQTGEILRQEYYHHGQKIDPNAGYSELTP